MTTIIGFCFAIGLALSAIAGVATCAEAAMHLFLAACASAVERLERSLNRAPGSEAASDVEFGRPRARWL